jgi:CheY-like chemotaxis protein
VLTTLHANDAVGSIRRFLDLGLDPGTVAEVLRGSLAQRLVRRVCPECAVPVEGGLTADEIYLQKQLRVAPTVRIVGCERCAGTGYLGRVPVTEFLVPSAEIVSLILDDAPASQIQAQATRAGMQTLLESGGERIRDGETTLLEVQRVLGLSGHPASNGNGNGAGPEPADHATFAANGNGADGGPSTMVPGFDPAEGYDEGALAEPEADAPHVLVVDDDGTLRTIARSVLQNAGYRVTDVADGSEALARMARGERYSLMVLDLDMPMLGGRDVLRAVRRSLDTAGLPVVVLTGTPDKDAEVQLLEQGADDYIRKPIEPKRFLLRVNAALRRVTG